MDHWAVNSEVPVRVDTTVSNVGLTRAGTPPPPPVAQRQWRTVLVPQSALKTFNLRGKHTIVNRAHPGTGMRNVSQATLQFPGFYDSPIDRGDGMFVCQGLFWDALV